VRPNGILQYDLCLYGRRFRESSGLRYTPENRRKVRKHLRRINAQWETGTFDYAAWFPHSRKLAEAQRWLRERGSRLPERRFAGYADEWYRLNAGAWKASYARQVRSAIDRHLIPRFGDWPLDAITERAIRGFRQALIDAVDAEGERCLSNARINFILTPLSGILRFAERELGLDNPMDELQPLRNDPRDPMPLTADEVRAFLEAVDAQYRLYFKPRFYTGLRRCEVNGLKVGYVDLERRQLRVREAIVDGRQTSLKHCKTRRDIPLSPTLTAELQQHVAGKSPQDLRLLPRRWARVDELVGRRAPVGLRRWTRSASSVGACTRRATPRRCCTWPPARTRCSFRACSAIVRSRCCSSAMPGSSPTRSPTTARGSSG